MYIVPLVLNVLCILIAVSVVISDRKSKRLPLFSLRNIFIAGFLYFQSFGFFSWILAPASNGWWYIVVKDKNYESSILYGFYLNLFLVILLLAYRVANFRIKPPSPRNVSPKRLATLSLAMTVTALVAYGVSRFVLQDFFRNMSEGIGVAATGYAVWAWSSKRKDPYFIGMVCCVLALSLVPHLTAYGRRGLVSLAGIIAWVAYFRITFNFSPVKLWTTTAILVAPMIVIIALFSEVRVKRPKTTQQAIEYMVNADLGRGMARLATFQGSAPISIWCLENFPTNYKQRHLYSLNSTFWFFVPRAIWRDKPPGLGIQIPAMAGMKRVGGLNVGAGMIGHAMAEGGVYALIVYACGLGILLKYLDSTILKRNTIFIVIPLASSLGNVFATSRGEVNYFIDLAFLSIVSALIATKVLVRLFFGIRRL